MQRKNLLLSLLTCHFLPQIMLQTKDNSTSNFSIRMRLKPYLSPLALFYIHYYTHMVLILEGHSEIGAHVRSNPCYLICSRQLIRSIAVTNRIFFLSKRDLCSFKRAQHVLSSMPMHIFLFFVVRAGPLKKNNSFEAKKKF